VLEKSLRLPIHQICFSFIFLTLLSSNTLEAKYETFGKEYQKLGAPKLYKKAFEETLLNKIKQANSDIIKDRVFVKKFFSRFIFTYSAFDRTKIIKLNRLAKKYRIRHLYDEKAYLKKIDTLPISLALAQAAIESAWGKSRFAREANNIFGEWTYGEKGLVPEHRTEGMHHKIKMFNTLDGSIKSYMLNLNRHAAYKEFRNKRAKYRKKWLHFGGLEAADTMEKYSGIGEKYNAIIVKTINQNGWDKFD